MPLTKLNINKHLIMRFCMRILANFIFSTAFICFISIQNLSAFTSSGSASPPSIQQSTVTQPTTPPVTPTQPSTKLPPKPTLPVMVKPFGMPGIVGFRNGAWTGTDYLGYLSNNIATSVEILKADAVPAVSDVSNLEARVAAIFQKENIIPRANVVEGPPLPFLHILLFIYPVEKDKFVVFGNVRLFEQIQVKRKDFSPAGYWQGITWETQDVVMATTEQLNTQINNVVDKLATAFAERYRLYNNGDDGKPAKQEDESSPVENLPTNNNQKIPTP